MTNFVKDTVHPQPVGAAQFEGGEPIHLASIYRVFGKRALDVIFVLAVAPIGATLVLLAALLSFLSDGRWPFYLQDRVGRDRRIFKIMKIRTMVLDADARLAEYLSNHPEARVEWEKKQKLEHDPRIIRFGNVLRKTSLDELPQLWNVLKGDMSIIGPRPMMVEQQELYPGSDYYELRPGITGPWQISDRSQGTFAGRARFDTAYNETLSLRNDVHILARTAGVVLRCTGR